jgi:hypothetical protein
MMMLRGFSAAKTGVIPVAAKNAAPVKRVLRNIFSPVGVK